ncbi:MAG: DMT family transporter, partial [Proteobacteria bacterium]|nr:DMT family transporter [Pseudomonadota bacterium]
MSAPALDAPDALSGLIPSRTVRGFVVSILSGLFFTLLNASVKELTHELPPLFVSWGRWVSGIVLIAPFMLWRHGLAGVATRNLRLHCLRGLFHSSGYALWYEAVFWLPLATMAAIGFTGPIFVTIGAVVFLGETVQWRRWLGVAVGFLGML